MGVKSTENNDNRYEITQKDESSANFEEAIRETGFGKYNYMLMFVMFVPSVAQLVNTVDLSYVLPIAKCDLELTLEDRGLLNAIIFAGMISSGFFWGYISDTLGRKNVVVYGYMVNAIFAITAALATDKMVLLVAKFFSGVFINGPYAAMTAHIAEFHSSKYRGVVTVARGTFISVGNLLLPILAWAVLQHTWDISVFGLFYIHAWNIFMLICAITTLLSGLLYIFIPESPKFLMTAGLNDEALIVMQQIYSVNTGKQENTFPVKQLIDENSSYNGKQSVKSAMKQGIVEMGKMLHRPHIFYLALACFNAFSMVMSLNTLKLWLPEIFQSVSDYQSKHNSSSSSMCVMIEEMKHNPFNFTSEELEPTCSVNLDNLSVYINTFIVAAARLAVFLISSYLVGLLGVKTLNITTSLLSSALLASIYFARSSVVVTILSAMGTAIGSLAENLLVALTLEMFPTAFRIVALSLHLTAGRAGTLIGNVIFPYLIYSGCLPPFLFIGAFGAACGLLSFFYSNVENKPLE